MIYENSSIDPVDKLDNSPKRCNWVTESQLYIDYHDHEWGVPCYDRLQLFAMLCLEGQQAGLSWYTVLKKREHYYTCFEQFIPEKVALFSEKNICELLSDPGLIRNRLKLNAIVKNAKALLLMEQNGENFVEFIWGFVNSEPKLNRVNSMADIPTVTDEAILMSKELKKRGFTFVGPTICYAFMQACGLVNDHLTDCIARH
ncbi:DNA-3-methyladenine glycosylase I [Thorsellia anophelis]|uniref:DNA-3-methyladenine glycosylase I n=1 Tax=Thorsellia anophelis DSM 18579 TaxID=1123402 RepID=A0A1H9Y4T8_9GAMM|nr:DNA-3-methyladenine glycosylase I [Thorsellia anophelis]SES63704.1 DNA-3-methyladenine glycosylase I [Thorsellia anophelis DSM 18579]